MILTKEGQLIVPIVREFLESMNRVLNEITNTESRSSIRVSLVQSFAVKWLVPRLGKFNELYPDISVWISTSDDLVNFGKDEVDIAIRLGHGEWLGLHVDPLLQEYVFPVCSPDFSKTLDATRKSRGSVSLSTLVSPLLRYLPPLERLVQRCWYHYQIFTKRLAFSRYKHVCPGSYR